MLLIHTLRSISALIDIDMHILLGIGGKAEGGGGGKGGEGGRGVSIKVLQAYKLH
jgi:hypothetical protein